MKKPLFCLEKDSKVSLIFFLSSSSYEEKSSRTSPLCKKRFQCWNGTIKCSLGMNSSMFVNCLVFCDVQHVWSSVFGQNVMFWSVRSSVLLLCDQASLGTYSLMFKNCSVFCDVRHVRSSILGQNVMFRKFDVQTFNVRNVQSSVCWCSFQD